MLYQINKEMFRTSTVRDAAQANRAVNRHPSDHAGAGRASLRELRNLIRISRPLCRLLKRTIVIR